MRVLVVEDEERIVAFIVKALGKGGHDVQGVGTGRAALALATATPPPFDVVLLDLGLPDLDGLAVLAELRAAEVSIPVIVVTTRLAAEERTRALALGADDYLRKPFALRDLLSSVDRLAPASGVPGAAPAATPSAPA